jgi:outer membrane protein assembly factor BamB
MTRTSARTVTCLLLAIFVSDRALAQGEADVANPDGDAILRALGVRAGLIAHINCGDGKTTAALGKSDRILVHGLEQEPAKLAAARKHIYSVGLSGRVSVEAFDGTRLPYAEHVVNAIVVNGKTGIPDSEVARVLVPGGFAVVQVPKLGHPALVARKGLALPGWFIFERRPVEGFDEWGHFAYDASGNAVSRDRVVGPPRRLRWQAPPRHLRSHEYTTSLQAVVTTNGRIFYIHDRGPIAALRVPSDWAIVARDAYNGLPLWERPFSAWLSRMMRWGQVPQQLQHRLVAEGDRVYVTLGYHAPVSALSAATGETIRVYGETAGADEVYVHRGVLLVFAPKVTAARVAEHKKWAELTERTKSPLHRRNSAEPHLRSFRKAERSAARSVLAIDVQTGAVLWRRDNNGDTTILPLSIHACGDRAYYQASDSLHCVALRTGKPVWTKPAPKVRTVSDEFVVCVGKKEITLLSAANGSKRWTVQPTLTWIRDVLVIGDSLWLGGGKPHKHGSPRFRKPSWGPFFAVQRDLKTGKVRREITAPNPGHHHRCYANKATERYILAGRRGTEFLDLKTGNHLPHSWARGTCRYGVMPANGLLYVPPHACGCYISVKLMGFNALAPAAPEVPEATAGVPAAVRLEKGPACDEMEKRKSEVDNARDWPTYRADARRTGRSRCAVPAKLRRLWQTELGGKLTPPVIAERKLFTARPDRYEIAALDAATGRPAWTFTAGGRIDSPPTVFRGRVLFGCRDGFVYCLRATDGALAWRFRAARHNHRIVVNGRLESPQPVHGSVLVADESVWLAAGRSTYLDGGLDVYRLDPASGKILGRTNHFSPDRETGRQPRQYGPNAMPGTRSEILSADAKHLYLSDIVLDRKGRRVKRGAPHIFALTDFLDDTWTHRSYWIYGTKPSISTGCSRIDRRLLYGRILVEGSDTVYGYGRENVHWSSEFEDGRYRLFARGKRAQNPTWSKRIGTGVRALTLAGDTLFAAGTPAEAPKESPKTPPDAALLLAVSAKDGGIQSRLPLPAAPVFDAMAAANGRLYLTLTDGRAVCFESAD